MNWNDEYILISGTKEKFVDQCREAQLNGYKPEPGTLNCTYVPDGRWLNYSQQWREYVNDMDDLTRVMDEIKDALNNIASRIEGIEG